MSRHRHREPPLWFILTTITLCAIVACGALAVAAWLLTRTDQNGVTP